MSTDTVRRVEILSTNYLEQIVDNSICCLFKCYCKKKKINWQKRTIFLTQMKQVHLFFVVVEQTNNKRLNGKIIL